MPQIGGPKWPPDPGEPPLPRSATSTPSDEARTIAGGLHRAHKILRIGGAGDRGAAVRKRDLDARHARDARQHALHRADAAVAGHPSNSEHEWCLTLLHGNSP